MRMMILFIGISLIGGSTTAAQLSDSPTNRDWKPLLRKSLTSAPWVGGAPPFRNRAAWQKIAARPNMQKTVARAEKLLTATFSPLPDELYLEFFRNGNRRNYEQTYQRLDRAANDFAMAYLLTADRRYLEKFEAVLTIWLQMKSWMLPAHDYHHRTFDQREVHVELASSLLSWRLGVAYALLRDELKPEIARELKRQLYTRTLTPVSDMLDGKRPLASWMTTAGNWNAVCWMAVTGCELAVEEDQEKKIAFVDAALRYIGYSLLAFPADGYCSEGMGYWNYGYGNNVLFAATIHRATDGQINLMDLPAMRRPADYAEKITIVPGVVPAYADCNLNIRPWPFLLGLRDYLQNIPSSYRAELQVGGNLDDGLLALAIPPLSVPVRPASPLPDTSIFAEAGIAIVRPSNAAVRLAASFKGGSNFELHNHNDVGSYVVVLDGMTMVFDPGREIYSQRTFSKDRYVSKLLNSYGHSVPVIGGKLQKAGKNTRAGLLQEINTPEEFRWTIDLAPAYQLPEIKTLTRTFSYLRAAPGRVSVRDDGGFNSPVTFETAIVTPGVFQATSVTGGTITYKGKILKVEVQSAAPVEFRTEEIKENVEHQERITRIGVRLREKTTHADLTITFFP